MWPGGAPIDHEARQSGIWSDRGSWSRDVLGGREMDQLQGALVAPDIGWSPGVLGLRS